MKALALEYARCALGYVHCGYWLLLMHNNVALYGSCDIVSIYTSFKLSKSLYDDVRSYMHVGAIVPWCGSKKGSSGEGK